MTDGGWCRWNSSRMISSVEPTSSAATPMLLIRAISLTPSMLIVVVITTRIAPSNSAFCAPRLRQKRAGVGGAAEELQAWCVICGSTTCQSTATAAIVTIAPTM